ncbi:MAG: alpha/beta hydrolase [Pseudomonadota bacterium]|nr:alpha/beta hydrolase [Pseudomonadota bacterium]
MIPFLRSTAVSLCALFGAGVASAAETAAAPERPLIKIWPGVAPGSESSKQVQQDTKAIWGDRIVRNVVSPTLEVFAADAGKATGTAVLIAPGGAFRFLSIDTEGTQVASWLASRGIASFILRYRLGETVASDALFTGQVFAILAPLFKPGPALLDDMNKYSPPAIADGREAMKLLRSRAAEFGIANDRIGFVGFSAGGVVGTGVSVSGDATERPDFFAAIYPGPLTLPKMPDGAPPLFIAAASDDSITAPGAKPLEAAWRAAGKPVEAHYYANGGHGFGMKKQGKESDVWTDQLSAWLDGLGMLKPVQ